MNKLSHSILANASLALLLFFGMGSCFAHGNFTFAVAPGTTLPTNVPAGGKAIAYIVVTNQSFLAQQQYHLKGVPAWVQQDTTSPNPTDIPTCPNPIYVGAQQSCLLMIEITGPWLGTFALCDKCACTTSGLNFNVSTFNNEPGIAVGSYFDPNFIQIPLIAHSSGGTDPWSYVVDSSMNLPPTTPAPLVTGSFVQGSCGGGVCMAVGTYCTNPSANCFNNSDGYPLLGMSTTGASPWVYPASILSFIPSNGFLPIFNSGSSGVIMGATVAIAAGSIRLPSPYFYPALMLAYSDTAINLASSTWTYLTQTPVSYLNGAMPPAPAGQSEYKATSCNSTFCLAAGYYTAFTAPNDLWGPLLVAKGTFNGGSSWTWSFPIEFGVQQPSDISIGSLGSNIFNTVSCSNSVCVAAGTYYPTMNITNTPNPILAESTSANWNTWTYPLNSSNVPQTPTVPTSFSKEGTFASASCNGTTCIAVGTYNNFSLLNNNLMLAYRTGPSAWSYVDIDSLIPAFSFAELNSVSCSSSVCVAVGDYEKADNSGFLPIVLYSTNGGANWTLSTSAITNLPNDYYSFARFMSVSCQANSCIAAGDYNSSAFISYPLLAESSDGGVTWKYAINSSNPALPADYSFNGMFQGTAIPMTKIAEITANLQRPS